MFAKRLRELRVKKELTQTELGRLFNLSKQAISSYETGGSTPSPDTLQRLADFFGVSVDYLLGRDRDIIRKSPLAGHYESQLPIDDDEELLETIERMLERRRQKRAAKAKKEKQKE